MTDSRVSPGSHFEIPDSALIGRKLVLSTPRTALQQARAGLGRIFLRSSEACIGSEASEVSGVGAEKMTVSGVNRASHFENADRAFAGRKRELSTLGAALQRARAGLGSTFLLSGEAGVGKTLLASEFAASARAGGAKVLEGRANARFRDALPFGVWKQILSDQPNLHDRSRSEFLPSDPSQALVASAPLEAFTDRQTHPELFETTARVLVEHARTQPLVLILDDLYAADPLSLQALRVFARELSRFGTVVIGVYRDSEIKRFQEFAEFLTDPLIRDSKRISLAAFDDEETREFVQSRTASQPDEGTLETLHNLTGGNPRLLDLALRHRLLDGTPPGSGQWLSGLLRTEIEAHLEHLSALAREVLSTASLAGVEFRLSYLAHVLEPGPGELLDSLQEAEQSGLLRRTEIPGTYRFRQTLVQETLCAELTGARRARLHKRFGEVLEALHPQDDAFVERLARHFYEAALLGCADKAADYCSRAAAQARSESRVDDALRFYHMALVALELRGSNPDASCDLRAKLEEVGPRPTHRASPDGRESQTSNAKGTAGETEAAAPNADRNGEQKIPAKPSASGRVEFSQEVEAPASSPTPLPLRPDTGEASDAVKRVEDRVCAPRLDESVAQPLSEFRENTFRREGDFWTLILEEQILRLKHSHGLVFVAHLLQHPDCDFHVAQLVALLPSARANHAAAAYISRSDKERLGMHTVSSDSNPLLDPTAKAEYRRRIEELRDALEEATAFNDTARAADLEKELDFIGLELSRAVGAGGRDREHRTEDERARVNVTNAIRTLTAKIAKEHPSFGRYLRLTIQTGRFCSYRPDPRSTPRWRF